MIECKSCAPLSLELARPLLTTVPQLHSSLPPLPLHLCRPATSARGQFLLVSCNFGLFGGQLQPVGRARALSSLQHFAQFRPFRQAPNSRQSPACTAQSRQARQSARPTDCLQPIAHSLQPHTVYEPRGLSAGDEKQSNLGPSLESIAFHWATWRCFPLLSAALYCTVNVKWSLDSVAPGLQSALGRR